MGFPGRWRNWISYMLSTASTKVLINGRPGHRIYHARGLRQGDPLSPYLFIIVMEVLNALLIEVDRQGQLHPLPGNVIKFRTSVYADDLVIFVARAPWISLASGRFFSFSRGRLDSPQILTSAPSRPSAARTSKSRKCSMSSLAACRPSL